MLKSHVQRLKKGSQIDHIPLTSLTTHTRLDSLSLPADDSHRSGDVTHWHLVVVLLDLQLLVLHEL